jgi:hypothetical protein
MSPTGRCGALASPPPSLCLGDLPLSRRLPGTPRIVRWVRRCELIASSFHPPDRSAPAFPTRFDPCRPTFSTPDCLSWGCQSTPLRRFEPKSPPRAADVSVTVSPSRAATPDSVPSSWFSTTATGFSSSVLPGCCTRLPAMGFTAFLPAANRDPRDAFPPFRAFSTTAAAQSSPKGNLRGESSPCRSPCCHGPARSRVPLPPRRQPSSLLALGGRHRPRGLAPQ